MYLIAVVCVNVRDLCRSVDLNGIVSAMSCVPSKGNIHIPLLVYNWPDIEAITLNMQCLFNNNYLIKFYLKLMIHFIEHILNLCLVP